MRVAAHKHCRSKLACFAVKVQERAEMGESSGRCTFGLASRMVVDNNCPPI